MWCLACASFGFPLCSACTRSLRPARSRLIGDVGVDAAFSHTGAAARLVHNLKYQRSEAAGKLLATSMAAHLPDDVDVLVPIPRVLSRRIGYGIDQTAVRSKEVSRLTGIPVVNALAAPPWNRRLAGAVREERVAPTFKMRSAARGRVCLVDDVCTSGSTVASAVSTLGCETVSAVVATLAIGDRVR